MPLSVSTDALWKSTKIDLGLANSLSPAFDTSMLAGLPSKNALGYYLSAAPTLKLALGHVVAVVAIFDSAIDKEMSLYFAMLTGRYVEDRYFNRQAHLAGTVGIALNL